MIEYDIINPVVLDPEMKKWKLQRRIAGDERLVNIMSTLCIATKATRKPEPLYDDHIIALTQTFNIHDAINISKLHVKLTNKRKKSMKALFDGGANGGITGTGTEVSRPLNSTFNCGRSVKVTSLGESML